MSRKTTTEVADRDTQGALSVGISELVALVVGVLGPVVWRVFELEATGLGALDLAALAERIEAAPRGLEMATDELLQTSADLDQVINAVLVVPGDEEPPMLPPLNAAFYASCRLVLECVDGDVWRITTDSDEVHRRLRNEFHDVVKQ